MNEKERQKLMQVLYELAQDIDDDEEDHYVLIKNQSIRELLKERKTNGGK